MRRAGQSIKDRIRYRRFINGGMPVFDWQLAANDSRACTDTIIEKLRKIVLARGLELANAKVVEDEEISSFIRMPKARPYLENSRLELDSNTAERAVKPVAIGRKNGCSPVPRAAAKPWQSPSP